MEKIVPEELAEVMDECLAAEKARDSAVKGYFKFQVRNAIYCGKVAEKKRREFWSQVGELYPDLAGRKLSYDSAKKTVSEI